jgi:hypothetical protein
MDVTSVLISQYIDERMTQGGVMAKSTDERNASTTAQQIGFREATHSGLSFATDDLITPGTKVKHIAEAEKQVMRFKKLYERGVITEKERYNQVLDTWTHAREAITGEMREAMRTDDRGNSGYVNPVYLMADSGARGGIEQIRQLAGMRGLMAKPTGEIIETPIKSNFREGLTVLEYFSSTHGARKGLADTALKTADSGYLTRKLADVAQNVVVTMVDCGTTQGITKGVIYRGEKVEVKLSAAITGRVSRQSIVNPITDEIIVKENELITPDIARKIEELGLDQPVIGGYDIGSRIAQAVARERPDLARALVVSPPLPGIGDRILSPRAQQEFWYQPFHQLSLSTELIDGRPDYFGRLHWSPDGMSLKAAALLPDVQLHGLDHSQGQVLMVPGSCFIGKWAPNSACDANSFAPPLTIDSLHALSSAGGSCEFQRIDRDASAWRVRALCAVEGRSWIANIKFTLKDQLLTWASEVASRTRIARTKYVRHSRARARATGA